MRLRTAILFVFFASGAIAQENTKEVALLPFFVTINGKSGDSARNERLNMSLEFQRTAYVALTDNEKKYGARIQDFRMTNDLLRKANIQTDQVDSLDQERLRKLLNVEGLIRVDIKITKPDVSIASEASVQIIFGVSVSDRLRALCYIYNSKGEVVSSFEYKSMGSPGINVNRTAKNFAQLLARILSTKKMKHVF